MNHFYSNGKLLITSEYMVLKGAEALSLPLKYGQHLILNSTDNPTYFFWKTVVKDQLWFDVIYDQHLQIVTTSDQTKAEFLQRILHKALQIANRLPVTLTGYQAVSLIDFDINWGWGSSSTLLSNLAYWFDIDPFELHFAVSNGSGYDIASARMDTPIRYKLNNQTPEYQSVLFNPPFKDQLYFIYSGKKQNSSSSVEKFADHKADTHHIETFSTLTNALVQCVAFEEFTSLLNEHNRLLKEILKTNPYDTTLFNDFEGTLKPLGAWGGDFYLAASQLPQSDVKAYFYSKGCKPVFTYQEIIKS